uniref:Uncharacterized protein n=1 Tax=Anguilla anguilla TaxID=7936 RepID=A0A0E9VWD6_ANGAN
MKFYIQTGYWLAEAYNREVVCLVLHAMHSYF